VGAGLLPVVLLARTQFRQAPAAGHQNPHP
jgi:hypothetical protein